MSADWLAHSNLRFTFTFMWCQLGAGSLFLQESWIFFPVFLLSLCCLSSASISRRLEPQIFCLNCLPKNITVLRDHLWVHCSRFLFRGTREGSWGFETRFNERVLKESLKWPAASILSHVISSTNDIVGLDWYPRASSLGKTNHLMRLH